MDRQTVLATLKAAETILRRQGVAHAALFGSLARGEQHAGSDIDIMVELQDGASVGVYGFVAIVNTIEDLFPTKVDVSSHDSLRPFIRSSAERDAIYAF